MLEWAKDLEIWWRIALWIFLLVFFVVLAWVGTNLNKRIFKKIQEKYSGIHLAFFERIISALIVVFCITFTISTLGGANTIWQTVFGGTAIVSAVIVFAAQDVIKDILAGLVISINKPFEIGDRIVLEDGTSGIVETITLRHVVLIGMDTLRIVVPNSKLNTMQLENYSYQSSLCSAQFKFSVSYDSNMEQVKKVIADAVEESEYSVPGKQNSDGTLCYGPVYFVSFDDSALIMAVTVYFEKEHLPATVINDINTRVREALIAHNIEIPYKYINIVATGKKN